MQATTDLVAFDTHGIVQVVDPTLLDLVSGGFAMGYRNNNTYYVNDQCSSNYANNTCVQANPMCGSDVACAEVI